jgi:hypothetical protein
MISPQDHCGFFVSNGSGPRAYCGVFALSGTSGFGEESPPVKFLPSSQHIIS